MFWDEFKGGLFGHHMDKGHSSQMLMERCHIDHKGETFASFGLTIILLINELAEVPEPKCELSYVNYCTSALQTNANNTNAIGRLH